MTDQRDSVTAAELDELDKRLEAQRDFGLVGTPYPVASYSDALDAIRTLRRELDEARAELKNLEAAVAVDLLQRGLSSASAEFDRRGGVEPSPRLLSILRAAIAKKDAALRKIAAEPECGCSPCTGQCRSQEALAIQLEEIRQTALDALAPAAQGKIASIYVGGVKVGEMEVPPIAPAPSAGETVLELNGVRSDEKKATLQLHLKADSGFQSREAHRISANQWGRIVAICVDLAAAPTTGETT